MVTQGPPSFHIDWFGIINTAFQYVSQNTVGHHSAIKKGLAFIAGFWPFIVLNEEGYYFIPERIVMFYESSSNRPLLFVAFHSWTMFQCFNPFLFFWQFLKALKRECVLSLSKQMVINTLVLFYGLEIKESTRDTCYIVRYLHVDCVTRYIREKCLYGSHLKVYLSYN